MKKDEGTKYIHWKGVKGSLTCVGLTFSLRGWQAQPQFWGGLSIVTLPETRMETFVKKKWRRGEEKNKIIRFGNRLGELQSHGRKLSRGGCKVRCFASQGRSSNITWGVGPVLRGFGVVKVHRTQRKIVEARSQLTKVWCYKGWGVIGGCRGDPLDWRNLSQKRDFRRVEGAQGLCVLILKGKRPHLEKGKKREVNV